MEDDTRTQRVGLGCGTLILIALIVMIVSSYNTADLEGKISELESTISELESSVKAQSSNIELIQQKLDKLLPMTQAQNGSGTVMIVQGLTGRSVAIVQSLRVEFVIPEAVFELIDYAGTTLALHTAEGALLDKIVTEEAVTQLPTGKLDAGTYILTAVSNRFSDTYLLHNFSFQ